MLDLRAYPLSQKDKLLAKILSDASDENISFEQLFTSLKLEM
jgi:hypothetical protein